MQTVSARGVVGFLFACLVAAAASWPAAAQAQYCLDPHSESPEPQGDEGAGSRPSPISDAGSDHPENDCDPPGPSYQIWVEPQSCNVPAGGTGCTVGLGWYAHHGSNASVWAVPHNGQPAHQLFVANSGWQNVTVSPPAVTYQLRVAGTVVESTGAYAYANQPPSVSLTSPSHGATYTAPASIPLAANASDSDGSISKVEFYNGGTLLATDTTAPYGFDWTNVPAGSYTLTARATDDKGAETVSAPVSVTVEASAPAGPPAPDALSDSVGATTGEFRVDESGAATYSIPIYAAPGTAGVTPQLTLSYSSQGGNGPAGRGWAIAGLSSISRCRASREAGDFITGGYPVDGNPAPVNFTSSDRFCLDGQRLIPVADSPACPTLAGATVTQLRTEIEGFQRVCAYTFNGANGPRFFTVERKDGSISWYGDRRATAGGSDGGVADGYLAGTGSGQADKILSWAQTRFQDSTGNYIDYAYLKNPGGANHPGEHLIHEVRYTGKVVLPGQSGSALGTYALIRFNYVAHPRPAMSYLAGGAYWQTRELRSITSINEGVQVRHYRLTHADSPSNSGARVLTALQECRDDSAGAVCLAPTSFAWSEAKYEFGVAELPSAVNFGSMSKFEGYKLADIDGDGRLDLVWLKDGLNGEACSTETLWVAFGELDGNGRHTFSQPSQTAFCTPTELISGLGDGSWFLFDYDGDGRDDLFVAGPAGQGWRLHLSQGRPSAGGRVFAISDQLASLAPAIPYNSSRFLQPQLADLNGDGLLDVIYPRNGQMYARLMERQGGSFRFGAERPMRFDVASSGLSCDEAGVQCFIESPALYRDAGHSQLFDFDGDSRSDVLGLVTQVITEPTGHCQPDAAPDESIDQGGDETEDDSTPPGHLIAGSPEEATPDSFACSNVHRWTFLIAFKVDAVGPGAGGEVVLSTYGGWNTAYSVSGDTHSASVYQREHQFADFNGDGLTDVLYKDGANQWRYYLNTGSGFVAGSAPLGTLSFDKHLKVVDINGDGRADVLYPVDVGSAKKYRVRYGLANGTFAAAAAPPGDLAGGCNASGCNIDKHAILFADLDGDGAVDFFTIYLDDNANFYGARAGAASRYRPRDVITRITNGLGAITELTYLPMTNRAVYWRSTHSRNTLHWGRGSAVQDFLAPMYLVARVQSSAPTYESDTALSTVYYRYGEARMQAGGRGFLGFRRIDSIDVNHGDAYGIAQTLYRQDFPYAGHPEASFRRVVTGSYAVDPCFTTVTNACFAAAGSASAPSYGGTLISEAYSVWGSAPAFSPGSQAPVHVRLDGSEEIEADLATGQRYRRVVTAFNHDAWGNPTTTAVDTYGYSAGNPALAGTVETVNSYTNDGAKWRLGRLIASTVTHKRPGQPDIVRSTAFAYDMSGPATGLLTLERVQPGAGAAQDLRTYYVLDAYGNRLRTHTCSAQLSEAECRSTAIVFQPGDPLRIQRYGRQAFDSRGRYLTATYAPFWSGSGAVEAATQTILARNAFGDITHARDHNGVDTLAVYGALGRPYYTWVETVPGAEPWHPAEGAQTWTTYRWCGTGANQVSCPTGARFREQVVADGAPTRWTYYDVLGRPILTAGQSFNAGVTGQDFAAVCTYHDALGRASRSSEPFFLPLAASGGAPAFGGGNPCKPASARYWTVTTYDALGRPTRVTHPDGSTEQIAYHGLGTTFTDPRGHERSEIRNALGELAGSTDAGGLTTTYAYDAAGHLTGVSRDGGRGAIVTSQQYDALGRKTRQTDPDAGTWDYAYNALGELIAQTDAGGQRIASFFDARGRVYRKEVDHAAGQRESTHSYVYDTAPHGRGRLASETVTGTYAGWAGQAGVAHGYGRSHSYDALGRPIGQVTTIDGVGYPTVTQYDALGRPWKHQDASARWLKTHYDARGFARAVCESSSGDSVSTCADGSAGTYQRTLATDARGQVIHERRGGLGALDVRREYDPATGRLRWLCSGSSCGLQEESYSWDAAGNLLSRDKAGQYKEVFSYDPLNRLTLARYERVLSTTWSPGSGPISSQQAYDRLGNLCQKTIAGTLQAYHYGGRAGCGTGGLPGSGTSSGSASPHAVTGAAGGLFYYDAHGNQTVADYAGTANDRYIRYTVEAQAYEIALSSQSSPSQRSRFWYGPDGQRYKREDSAPGTTTRRTLYLGNVEVIQQGGVTTTKRYVAGVLVQEIQGTTTTSKYLFADHLGSVVRVTNASGGVLEGMDYGAFGERRGYVDPRNTPTIPTSTTRGFTGHEMLDGLDVIHMSGRIYDSKLGRFLQPDPIVQEPNNPQNFNRYTYVLNNPLSYTDPSGYSFLKKYWRSIVAIAINVFLPGSAFFTGLLGITNSIAQMAVTGFLSGVVSTGTLKGGILGAFTAGVGADIASAGLHWASNALAQGAVNGLASVLGGGKFGHGFASAGIAALAAPGLRSIRSDFGRALATAAVGGTVSKLTGGKFANGAVTGAMQAAVSSLASRAEGRFSAPGAEGAAGVTVVSVEAQTEFAAIADSLTTDLAANPAKTFEEAATRFGDAFLPWTEKHGLEAGANIVPIKGGLGIADASWGGRTGVFVPRNPMALAHVHTHPVGSGAGFSGTLRYVGGRLQTGGGHGDYGSYWDRGVPGYVFRGGDRAGWFFDYHGFSAAYSAARAAGTDTYAEWYTRRIR